MMFTFLIWYLMITGLGLVTFPMTFKVFHKLADRGYAFSKIAGLLICAYIFWLLTSLGILQNSSGGILFAFLLLLLVNVWILFNDRDKEIKSWFAENLQVVLFIELVFFIAFLGWTLMRAANPGILGTEKPMELAFISSILRSDAFPPKDPWLSGYSISYYYFGYVMVAMLAKVSHTASWVAFNISSALWFALTASGAMGVMITLFSRFFKDQVLEKTRTLIFSTLGPLFILLVSNIEGFLEMLHAKGLFWQTAADGSLQSKFWSWLGIQELVNPPSAPYGWLPERVTGIWWWRASRVLQDFTASGQSKEIIDEFPFFSYYLADLHPHVLAMPFVLLAIGFALNFFLKPVKADSGEVLGLFAWLKKWVQNEENDTPKLRIAVWLKDADFWAGSLIFGGLAFLNTWDFPIYVALFAAAAVIKSYKVSGWRFSHLYEFLELCISLAVSSVVLYFPFYTGFASQAGGFLPSLHFFTMGRQLWVMFLPLLVPIFLWLLWFLLRNGNRKNLTAGLKFSALIVVGLFILSYLYGALIAALPLLGNLLSDSARSSAFISLGDLFFGLQGTSDTNELIWGSILRRLMQPGAWITLFLLIFLIWASLASFRNKEKAEYRGESSDAVLPVSAFVILMIFVGSGLVLAPEYFYLRDQFAWRMNTIFKFYFQAWILWGLAAAYGLTALLSHLKINNKILLSVLAIFILFTSLAYPYYGMKSQFKDKSLSQLSLDGAYHLSDDEMEAIEFLLDAPLGVVAEAIGGSYSGYARVATYSGQSNVLGWPGHESQWRGGAKEMGSREEDVRRLYQSNDWYETEVILSQYDIRYVYVGSLENSAYKVNRIKFDNYLPVVFFNNSVTIYEVPGN